MPSPANTASASPTLSPEWLALSKLSNAMQTRQNSISELFRENPERLQQFSLEAAGLQLDFSKNLLTQEALDALLELAEKCGMQEAIAAMFAGETINNTEQRPALHVALRSPDSSSEAEKAVHTTLGLMSAFADRVLTGDWQGFSGQSISDVVNIGIGGSDLGPAMVYEALRPYHQRGIKCHFVSNVDPVHLEQTLSSLNAETTLFVIASKSFTTLETSLNATSARGWLLEQGCSEADLHKHFVAVSANVDKAVAFGIAENNIFPMWDWVGGRYSLWSAIGLPLILGLGIDNFRALLAGAHDMDEHFRTAPPADNMPVLLALLNLWYSNFWQAQSKVILPYLQNLHLLPAFLQQLDMESLGKQVMKDGSQIDTVTGSILWGSAGTNGQHSFHQLLHQGTMLIPADFIAARNSHSPNLEQHQQLLANCFAQSQALMDGKSLQQATDELLHQGLDQQAAESLAPHKVIPGNRPSNTIMMDKLTPASLGALIALYEHKVYAHSVLLGINAFDQWGVELGKVLGTGVYQAITAEQPASKFDASTNALINQIRP